MYCYLFSDGEMCGLRRAHIYVGHTPEDFWNNEALICQRDVTVGEAFNNYIDECVQPIKGRYFTILNYANVAFDEFALESIGPQFCLNLCAVDVYIEGKTYSSMGVEKH